MVRGILIWAICIGIAVLATLFSQARAQTTPSPSEGSSHSVSHKAEEDSSLAGMSKTDILDLVREGRFNPGHCIQDTAAMVTDELVVSLHNDCEHQVNVSLCSWNAGSNGAGHVMYLVRSGATVTYRIPIDSGNSYGYRFNSCNKPNCRPPDPTCGDP